MACRTSAMYGRRPRCKRRIRQGYTIPISFDGSDLFCACPIFIPQEVYRMFDSLSTKRPISTGPQLGPQEGGSAAFLAISILTLKWWVPRRAVQGYPSPHAGHSTAGLLMSAPEGPGHTTGAFAS